MRLNLMLVLICIVVLGGCATKYSPNVNQPTNLVEFELMRESKIGFWSQPTSIFLFENDECEEALSLGMLKGSEGEEGTSFVSSLNSNKTIILTFRTPVRSGYSYLSTVFTPKSGVNYRFELSPPYGVELIEIIDGVVEKSMDLVRPEKACRF